MAKLKKILSVALATVLCSSLCLGSAYTGVSAVSSAQTYTIKDLYDSDQIKLLGRTSFVSDNNNNLLTEWAGSGFEMNIDVPAGGTDLSLVVYYNVYEIVPGHSPAKIHDDIILVGEDDMEKFEDFRFPGYNPEKTEKEITIIRHIPAGKHTVRIIRDSGPDKYVRYTHQYKSISFTGDILAKPENKKYYLECIGDSYTNASGTLNPLTPGAGGGSESEYSSIVNSWAYRSAEALGADCSILAMGGYGILPSSYQSSVEASDTGTSMIDLYPYVDAENDFQYSKSEKATSVPNPENHTKADAVVVTIGANDGQTRMTDWEAAVKTLINNVREKNGADTPVVWVCTGHGTMFKQYMLMIKLAKEIPNLHVMRMYVGGNGGNAGNTQTEGHMSYFQEAQMGEYITNFITSRKVLAEDSVAPTPAETTVECYVDGTTGGNGTLASPFSYIKDAEAYLHDQIAQKNGTDASIDAKIYVMNNSEWVKCSDSANGSGNSLTGYTTLIKSKSGSEITVEIIGYDSAGTGKKSGMLVANGGSATNPWRKLCNNYRFENIVITGQGDNTLGGFLSLYANGYSLTFDIGTEIYNSTSSKKISNNYFSNLYGGDATSTSGVVSEAMANYNKRANIVINSGKIINLGTIGISSAGAYSTTKTSDNKAVTDLSKWKYDVFTTPHYYNATINGGYVENLCAGTNPLVTGKNVNVNITVNGGHIQTLRASMLAGTSEYSKAQYGNFTVNVNGGNIDKYVGLTGGTGTYNYYGNCTFNMTAGTIGKPGTTVFKTTESNVNVKNLTNNIYEGSIYVEPVSNTTGSYDGVFFGGYTNTTVETLVNNISGGEVMVRYPANTTTAAAIFFGGENNYNATTVNNNVSGGRYIFYPIDESVPETVSTASGAYFGALKGNIDTLNNNISGGLFDGSATSHRLMYNMSSKTIGSWVGKLNNVIGVENTDRGPAFLGGMPYYGGTSTSYGANAKGLTSQLDETDINNMSDEVVISNTIHSMTSTGSTVLGPSSNRSSGVVHVLGSIESTINAGIFGNTLICSGGEVYGHVKTTINGGYFNDVYGAGSNNKAGKVYNGAELIVNGATGTNKFVKGGYKSYANIAGKNTVLSGGNKEGTIPKPLTEGRPAVKLTINGGTFPERNIVYAASNMGTVEGDVENLLCGGSIAHYFGGSNTGTVNGNISNTSSAKNSANVVIKTFWRGGSNTGIVNGNITNTMNAITIDNNWYAFTDGAATLNGNITNYIKGGTYKYTTRMGATNKATVIGDITSTITAKAPTTAPKVTFSAPVYAGCSGNHTGNVVINVNTDTGNTIKTLQLGPDAGYTQTGTAILNATTSHFEYIYNKGTVTGGATVNFDGKGTTIVNNNVGTSDCGNYTVNYTAGTGEVLVTTNTNIEIDNVDTTANTLKYRMYTNAVAGKAYVTLPENTDVSKIQLFEQNGQNWTNKVTALKTDTNVLIIGVTGKLLDTLKANFTLDEALTANVYVEKTAPITELITKNGKSSYTYSFLGETHSGYFTNESETVNIEGKDYFKISFGVPTGKMDEKVSLYIAGCVNKEITIIDILENGKTQYQSDADVVALFDSVIDYGAEAKALYYGGEATENTYDEITDEVINKYSVAQTLNPRKYVAGANLLLLDKVSIQLYTNNEDLSAITDIKLNGASVDYTVSDASASTGFKKLISIRITAKDMYKAFKVEIYEGATKTDEYTSSVGFFCGAYIRSTSPVAAPYVKISKAILNYILCLEAKYDE